MTFARAAQVAVTAAFVLATACDSEPRTVVLRGATIIDGTGRAPIVDGTLISVDGRISCVGGPGVCDVPATFDDVDATGFWIIPGLIDTHVHPLFDAAHNRSWRRERLRFMLGITTTRDASTAGNLDGNVRAGARGADGQLPTPRLFVSGRITPDEAGDAESGAAAVKRLAAAGATSIKLKAVFPRSTLDGIIGAARELEFDVWGHAWAGDERPTRSLISEDVAAGYAGIAHLTGIAPMAIADSVLAGPPDDIGDPRWLIWRKTLWTRADPDELDRVARDLAAAEVWLEPLLVVEERWTEPYDLPPGLHRLAELPAVVNGIREPAGIPERSEADRALLRESMEMRRSFVKAFHDAGGVVVTGSDNALAPGLSLQEEIKALVRAGLTAEEALTAATASAATVIGAADSLGTLESGKLADFVVLEGDPLADIRNIEMISRVAKGGVLHDPADLLNHSLRPRSRSVVGAERIARLAPRPPEEPPDARPSGPVPRRVPRPDCRSRF